MRNVWKCFTTLNWVNEDRVRADNIFVDKTDDIESGSETPDYALTQEELEISQPGKRENDINVPMYITNRFVLTLTCFALDRV